MKFIFIVNTNGSIFLLPVDPIFPFRSQLIEFVAQILSWHETGFAPPLTKILQNALISLPFFGRPAGHGRACTRRTRQPGAALLASPCQVRIQRALSAMESPAQNGPTPRCPIAWQTQIASTNCQKKKLRESKLVRAWFSSCSRFK